jgi:hypothetical protein
LAPYKRLHGDPDHAYPSRPLGHRNDRGRLIFGLPIVAVLAGVWFKVEQMKSENDLKRSMIERGMTVEEIERVLAIRKPAK